MWWGIGTRLSWLSVYRGLIDICWPLSRGCRVLTVMPISSSKTKTVLIRDPAQCFSAASAHPPSSGALFVSSNWRAAIPEVAPRGSWFRVWSRGGLGRVFSVGIRVGRLCRSRGCIGRRGRRVRGVWGFRGDGSISGGCRSVGSSLWPSGSGLSLGSGLSQRSPCSTAGFRCACSTFYVKFITNMPAASNYDDYDNE